MKKFRIKWPLILYDIGVLAVVDFILLYLYQLNRGVLLRDVLAQGALTLICMLTARIICRVYQQIWRYGGIQCYMRLMMADGFAFVAMFVLDRVLFEHILPFKYVQLPLLLAVACMNLLGALAIRMIYRYAYKCSTSNTPLSKLMAFLMHVFAGVKLQSEDPEKPPKIRIAIVGAGSIGVSLAEDLASNRHAAYLPVCFVDTSKEKINRTIHEIPVLMEGEDVFGKLNDLGVQEVVFAISKIDEQTSKDLYERYLNAGYKIKVYDYPMMQGETGKRAMRDFDIEELLFRKPIVMDDEKTVAYYKNKTVLITGGGGSIGSELCRQLAKMSPRKIIILDIYENGAYDVQQELKIAYGGALDLQVEIASINNKRAMRRVFETYHPDIVINAAAHKHVPLMEHNCIEAVENNVFGTKILVDLCEEYGTGRFMMVSTDKAVNPTNVMGATKRMCEMIVQSAATHGKVKYSATRFGNVLGSAGSVIPLFKRQIANGGPITLTDKRIIRYFMTIPEASQLVLQSGAMANNGELFVLDMGQPVKILNLAQNMIRLSGVSGIDIVETGLRPGEKLYEELLVKTEELDKTENSLIFIEKDQPYPKAEIDAKLERLAAACATEDDDKVRRALRIAVPTFKTPEEVNADAENSAEMKDTVKA